MKREEYFNNAFKAFNERRVSEEVFSTMLDNSDAFYDEENSAYPLDFDDMTDLHYML